MGCRGNHKLPVKRLSDEELAARDFVLDFMMEEEFTDFLYTVGERTFVCGNGNNGYLDMVINKKRGWVIEIEGCSCETGRGEKDSNGSKGEKKGK